MRKQRECARHLSEMLEAIMKLAKNEDFTARDAIIKGS